MKIRFVQMEVVPGNPRQNADTMIAEMHRASAEGVELIVFPELCLPGYLIGDLWEAYDFLEDCEAAEKRMLKASAQIAVVWGSVAVDWHNKGEDGHVRRINAFKFAVNGVLQMHPNLGVPYFPKALSPNYRLFDEHRYFYDLRKISFERSQSVEELLSCIEFKGKKIAVSLCEDAWDEEYSLKPLPILQEQNPDLHINLSCSPFSLGKVEKRHRVFEERVKEWKTPLVYLNAVSTQNTGKTLYSFDGRSMIFEVQKGARQWGAFCEGSQFDFVLGQEASVPSVLEGQTPESQIFRVLRHQIHNYMQASGLQRVVIGASGGIDSAVSAALFAQVLGAENLLLVNMPSRYNSGTTKNLAKELAENIGCWYAVVPIEESVELSRRQMGNLEIVRGGDKREISLTPFHFENVQARDRSARILSALACSFGGVFTCNANKAEMTVGYSTLYGDLGGFIAPLGDLWKEQVYSLGRHLNERAGKILIPEGIFTVVPSAELSDQQDVDQDQGDPMTYWYHDRLFKSWVEDWVKKTPADHLHWYASGELNEKLALPQDVYELFPTVQEYVSDLERWWKLFRGLGVVKRVQAPPVCAVSRRPFGFDFREAIIAPPLSQKFLDLREKLLSKRGDKS